MPAPPSSPLTVALFSGMAELAGASSETVAWSGGSVADLRRELGVAHPKLIPLLERSAVAVAGQYATDTQPVAAGSEVAIIPPVSGG
ncbi:MAG: MoaD/ThiS family protein [Planctomycetota bacterium]